MNHLNILLNHKVSTRNVGHHKMDLRLSVRAVGQFSWRQSRSQLSHWFDAQQHRFDLHGSARRSHIQVFGVGLRQNQLENENNSLEWARMQWRLLCQQHHQWRPMVPGVRQHARLQLLRVQLSRVDHRTRLHKISARSSPKNIVARQCTSSLRLHVDGKLRLFTWFIPSFSNACIIYKSFYKSHIGAKGQVIGTRSMKPIADAYVFAERYLKSNVSMEHIDQSAFVLIEKAMRTSKKNSFQQIEDSLNSTVLFWYYIPII